MGRLMTPPGNYLAQLEPASSCRLASETAELATVPAGFLNFDTCRPGHSSSSSLSDAESVALYFSAHPPVCKSLSDLDLPRLVSDASEDKCKAYLHNLRRLAVDQLQLHQLQQEHKRSFRRSIDCLYNKDFSQAPSSPSLSPAALRKVASCATTALEKEKKRVKFADEAGKMLVHIRWIREPTHMPPKLSIHINGNKGGPSFTAGSSSSSSSSSSGSGSSRQDTSNEDDWELVCKFAQPSTKYIVFRECLEKNCVSLSSVELSGRTVKGLVVVKNMSFAKRVFVRATFDSWSSWRDVEAAYCRSMDRHDEFTFSFECPASADGAQFCVGFQCDGSSFWDSNGGENYAIVVKRRRGKREPLTRDCKPNFGDVPDFADFSVWDHFSDRVYY